MSLKEGKIMLKFAIAETNWTTGKYLDTTWTKERYLAFRKAYNNAVIHDQEFFIFERQVIVTRFAYFFLKQLHARFEH